MQRDVLPPSADDSGRGSGASATPARSAPSVTTPPARAVGGNGAYVQCAVDAGDTAASGVTPPPSPHAEARSNATPRRRDMQRTISKVELSTCYSVRRCRTGHPTEKNPEASMTTRLLCVLPVAALLATTTTSHASPATCPPLWERGVLELPWRPAFLHVDRYGDGEGLTISSFFNAYRNTQPGPPFITYARDRVARIPHLASVDPATFDAADLEELTDRDTDESAPGRTVWPNEAVRAPRGVFPFEAVVVPQGFHPAAAPGRLTAVDVATGAEYVIHQSTQAPGGFTNPFDPTNRPRFYHRVLFADMTGDGRADLVSARSGFRVGPFFYPPFAELVYFENPGDALDPATPWREVVLWGGPAAGFMGPDIHLDMFDFERDGVPEIVATHFFSGGTIALYGAPAGGTWADVDVLASRLPRVAVLSNDQGLPFDVQVADLDGDGRVDILASNHQPDGCTPQTSSPVPGRVFALEQPADSAIFTSPWTTHVLLDDIRSNPTMPGAGAPGRLAPGRAQVFWP
ncbi:MAG: VCBS repeat-containing protein, partial [Kofleriaceae bacterium]